MKCNLECPYSKPNGRDRNGNQNIICESRNWYMTDTDDCIEKFDEEKISQLKGIFGDTIMPREKFRVFTEIPTNEKIIVNMITDDQLTLEDACNLLNEQDQQIKKTKEVLQKHYDYADTQRQKNLDNAIVAEAYNVLRVTVVDIADELGIGIKK